MFGRRNERTRVYVVPVTVASEFEQRHPASHPSDLFGAHRLDVLTSDGGTAISCLVVFCGKQATFTGVVLDAERQTAVHQPGISAPQKGWELRDSGIWAEQTCEATNGHWTYGLEAFALNFEEPDSLLGSAMGTRVPLGWELDFEATSGSQWLEGSKVGYQQIGTAHGLLLDESGEREVVGEAIRSHWWDGAGPTSIRLGKDRIGVGSPVAEIWTPGDLRPWHSVLWDRGFLTLRGSQQQELS